MGPKRARKAAAPAGDDEVPAPAAKKAKTNPVAIEIKEKRTGRRTTEYLIRYDKGADEWDAHPDASLISAFDQKLRAAGIEKVIRHEASPYADQFSYVVKWKKFPEACSSTVRESEVNLAVLEAYWRPLKIIKEIVKARKDDKNKREYYVSYKPVNGRRIPNEWISRSLVPKDLADEFDTEEDTAEKERKQKEQQTIKWKAVRGELVKKWSAWYKEAAKNVLYLQTQNGHWVKCICSAVHANSLDLVKDLLTNHKQRVISQTSIPSFAGRNLFEWAVHHNNIPLLELLAAEYTHVQRQLNHIVAAAKDQQSSQMLDALKKLFLSTLNDIEGFAVTAVRYGHQVTFVKCYEWITAICVRDKLPENGANCLRPIHLAAATASAASDLPEPLDELTCNAPALGQYCTPMHLAAALNPNTAIFKALLKAGGDETIADDSSMLPMHYAAVNRHGCCKELIESLLQDMKEAADSELDRILSVSLNRDRYGRALSAANPLYHALKASVTTNATDLLAMTDKRLSDINKTLERGSYDDRHVAVCISERNWQGLGLLVDRPEYDGVFSDDLTLTHEKLIATIKNADVATFVTIAAESFQRKKTDGSIWDHKDELVLLYCAISEDSFPFVRLLVEHYKCRVNDIVDNSNSPLRAAVGAGAYEIAAFLMEHGAWTRQRDQFGTSILMTATRNGETECAQLLVRSGVDINSTRDEDQALIEQLKQELVGDTMDETHDGEAPKDPNKPFEDWVCVVTGDFNVGQWGICRWIENYGGRIVQAVSGKTTHCICGRDGVTEWGQRTGRGSKKYQESKRKKLPMLDENDVAKLVGKVPRKLTAAQELEQEVVGTPIHDLMQFNVDSATLSDTLVYLASLTKDIYALDEEGRTPLHCLTEYTRETPNTVAMLRTYLQLLQGTHASQASLTTKPTPADINATNFFGLQAIVDAAMRSKWTFCEVLLEYPGIAVDVYELIPKKRKAVLPTDEVVEPKANNDNDVEMNDKDDKVDKDNSDDDDDDDDDGDDDDDDDNADNANAVVRPPPPSPDEQDVRVKNKSLLHLFIQIGRLDLVQKLIAVGANPNIVSLDAPRTPALCLALTLRHDHIVTFLLGLPAIDSNTTDFRGVGVAVGLYQRDCQGFNPHAHYSQNNVSVDPLERLLEFTKINPSLNIKACDKSGTYLPHILCQSAQNRQLSFRYFFGAELCGWSLACRSVKCTSPFAVAIAHHQYETASALLDLGACVNDTLRLSAGDEMHAISVLRYCLSNYHADNCVTKAVLAHPKLDRATSLLDAIAVGNVALAKKLCLDKSLVYPDSVLTLLLGSQSSTDLFQSLLDTLSPEHRARTLAHTDIHANNMAPLQKAVSLGKPNDMVQKLCLAISDPRTLALCDSDGCNIIHTIVLKRNVQVLSLVLKHAQDIGAAAALLSAAEKNSGNTPLHMCVCETEIGGYTLNHVLFGHILKVGGDVMAKNAQNKTVAWLVGSMGPATVDKYVKVLKQHEGAWKEDTVGKEIDAGLDAHNTAAASHNESQSSKTTQNRIVQLEKQRAELKLLQAKLVEEDLKNQTQNTASLIVPVMESVHDSSPIEVLVGKGDGKGGDVYDAMLRLVDVNYKVVGRNQYAHLQILKRILPKEKELQVMTARGKLARLQQRAEMNIVYARKKPYLLVIKWGRIGSFESDYARQREWEGQTTKEYTSVDKAREDFEAAYEERAGHPWSQRFSGKKAKADQYTFVQRQYTTKHEAELDKDDKDKSALQPQVKELMSQICDESLLWRAIRDNGISSDLLPLGMMRADVIQQGFGIVAELQEINNTINTYNKVRGRARAKFNTEIQNLHKKIKQLTNLYFTLIPYGQSLRFSNLDVATELRKLQSFMEIVEGNLLMCDAWRDRTKSRLDKIYDRLFTNISPINNNTPTFQLLEQFINNGKTKGQLYQITSLYAVDRVEDNTRFLNHIGNRTKTANDEQGERPSNMLLWHGTSGFNILGILSKGLCIAPPEAPVSGYMFGKGIYFADTFDKSVSYCDSSKLALVCEVSLGESYCLRHSDHITELPDGFQSTKGVGRNAPDRQGMFATHEGIGVPFGGVCENAAAGSCSLNYNEYIVYDVTRVRIAYLVRFATKPAAQGLDVNAYRTI